MGQKVIFKNGGSKHSPEIKLDPDWRIDITNICDKCDETIPDDEKNPDFEFYYPRARIRVSSV